MVYDGIVIAIVLSLFRGGNFKGIADLRLKHGWIFPLLLVMQFLFFMYQSKFQWMAEASNYVYLGVYVVGLYFLLVNRRHSGFHLIFIGVLLNFIVMAANGGRMPVSLEAASVLDPYFVEVLKEGIYAKHQALTDSTWFGFLGDIIPLSSPYPREQVISIGDVVMNIGIFLFIQNLMLAGKRQSSFAESPGKQANH